MIHHTPNTSIPALSPISENHNSTPTTAFKKPVRRHNFSRWLSGYLFNRNRFRCFFIAGAVSLSPYEAQSTATPQAETNGLRTMADAFKVCHNILRILDYASPLGAYDSLILSVIQGEHPNTTQDGLRRDLAYLAGLGLIKAEQKAGGRWFCKLGQEVTILRVHGHD